MILKQPKTPKTMPKYSYYCENCKAEFEIIHSIKETRDSCEICKTETAFKRLPSISTILTKKGKTHDHKTGALVEEYIDINREQLEKEKDKLKKVEYK